MEKNNYFLKVNGDLDDITELDMVGKKIFDILNEHDMLIGLNCLISLIAQGISYSDSPYALTEITIESIRENVKMFLENKSDKK